MNHGKGHLHTISPFSWMDFPDKHSGNQPWQGETLPFSSMIFLSALPSMDHFPLPAHADVPGAGGCHELLQSPGVFAQHGQGTPPWLPLPSHGHTKSMMVLILKDWGNEMPQEKIDELFKMAVILQYDTDGFILIFLLIQAKFDGWRQLLCGLYPFIRFPPKMANCSRMSQIVTP